jgi:hypothetical protein
MTNLNKMIRYKPVRKGALKVLQTFAEHGEVQRQEPFGAEIVWLLEQGYLVQNAYADDEGYYDDPVDAISQSRDLRKQDRARQRRELQGLIAEHGSYAITGYLDASNAPSMFNTNLVLMPEADGADDEPYDDNDYVSVILFESGKPIAAWSERAFWKYVIKGMDYARD